MLRRFEAFGELWGRFEIFDFFEFWVATPGSGAGCRVTALGWAQGDLLRKCRHKTRFFRNAAGRIFLWPKIRGSTPNFTLFPSRMVTIPGQFAKCCKSKKCPEEEEEEERRRKKNASRTPGSVETITHRRLLDTPVWGSNFQSACISTKKTTSMTHK